MQKYPVILVTGASRGLGRGIAIELAKRGFSVALNYAGNQAAAEESVSLCQQASQFDDQQFFSFQANISKKEDRLRLIEEVTSKMQAIDGLVNNAGIAPKERADITEASEESFLDLMQTNLMGPYFLTQALVQSWFKDTQSSLIPSGRKIVFVTSISSDTASTNRGDYCISKAGLSMAVQLWASRLAEENIQVYELKPGIMKTDMTSAVQTKYDKLIDSGLVPQKRWGTPEDLGLSVASLMEGHFPFSTGTVIDVDGGFRIKRL